MSTHHVYRGERDVVEYRTRLQERQRRVGRPIRVGLVGAGQMGRGFVAQVRRIDGMEVVAIADIAVERAIAAFEATGVSAVAGEDPTVLSAAIEAGEAVVCNDSELLTSLPVDIVIEASGIPSVAAAVAWRSLLAGRHVGLLTVEADVTVGLLLASVARRAGLVYTVCRGDEPVEAKLLVDYARDLALEVICAGKGKNNPLRPHAFPGELMAEADEKHMNPKMLCSFVDGSKTMVEMAALANATGLSVSQRGMNGPAATIATLGDIFRPIADGGILERSGVVDYATGPIAPGLFVVVRSEDPTVVAEMDYLKMGSGPYYALYRPYHLASIEAPLTVASAVLDGVADMTSCFWTAEVVATAKRALRSGQKLDGIGGESVYGCVDRAEVAHARGLLPLGLVAGATMIRSVEPDQPLTYDDVALDESSTIVTLRRLQDQIYSSSYGTGVGEASALKFDHAVA